MEHKLCDYQAHYDDLCTAYRLWFPLNNDKTLDDDIRYALLDSIIIRYFRCFNTGKRKYKLQFGSIIKMQAGENKKMAQDVHEKFKNIRNKVIAHDERLASFSNSAKLVAIIDPQKEQPLEHILLWNILSNRMGFDILTDLLTLIQFTRMWVEQEMSSMTEELTVYHKQFAADYFTKHKPFRCIESVSSSNNGYVYCGNPADSLG